MKWWNEYNNIVTLEFPGADLKKLDLNKVVSELYSNKISVICAFANSYYPANVCYYNSNILEKHIDLGEKDLLKETNNLCAHYGIKFIPYLASIWAGKDVYLKNKNWAQIKKNGDITQWDEEFNSVAMCFHSE